jgi:CheY-like chemotaxis protein
MIPSAGFSRIQADARATLPGTIASANRSGRIRACKRVSMLAALKDHTVQMTALIVDDEPDVLRYMSIILEGVGYEILAADGGDEALALCKLHVIDVMISDVAMPRMNGRELAECVNAQYPDVPIVFVSGYPESKEILAGLNARGFAHGYTYLQKPFRPEALLKAIKAAFKIATKLKVAAAH